MTIKVQAVQPDDANKVCSVMFEVSLGTRVHVFQFPFDPQGDLHLSEHRALAVAAAKQVMRDILNADPL